MSTVRAGVLAALADARCRVEDGALPAGVRIELRIDDKGERTTWGRALAAAGALVVDSDPDLVIVGDADDTSLDESRVVVCDRLVPERVSALLRRGALDILVRPIAPEQVVEACRHAFARLPGRPMRRERRSTGLPVSGATGAALARTRLPVLLVGETGTGKSRMARKLHDTLAPGTPYVEVNAASLASNLITSELFGYERGAFTGAHASKPGLVSVADGGTLFLDEIGDLAPDAQVQLLSFLDNGTYRPVGGVRELNAQVRVFCATNRDLSSMVADGRFRDDLYYRLASIVIPLPPLRQSAERIPVLVLELVEQITRRSGTRPPILDDDALRLFSTHPWPGNVRQLRFVVERMVALFEGAHVSADAVASLLPASRSHEPDAPTPLRSLAEMERDLVERAMRHTGGNRTRAAELLGITPRGLYNKLRRNGTSFRRSDE